MSILVANTLLPPRTHIACVFADQGEGNIGELAGRVSFSFLHSLSSNTQTRNHPKPSRPCDLGLGLVNASTKPVSVVGRILYIDALARNLTLALVSCTHNNAVKQIHFVASAQAVIPLSYAAQIPTTHNPDLANVRVSLSNLDQDVRQCSARFL